MPTSPPHGPSAPDAEAASVDALRARAPFRRALVLANPIAGRGRGETAARELLRGLDRLGIAAELHLTSARGDGRARVRCLEPGTDLVVSVGGDGTLREVFDGLVDPEVPVAVLPMGTANVLGLDLRLPRDVDGLLETVAARRARRIDVADVNGHLSFLVTGVGFDARTVREVEARRAGPISRSSYLTAALRALRGYRPPRLEVELDGERLREPYGQVLISNIVHYGGVMRLRGPCRKDDGLYEVYLFRSATPLALGLAALRGMLASLPGGTCSLRQARHVRVESEEPVDYQVDGDHRGVTPVELRVTGRQHLLLAP